MKETRENNQKALREFQDAAERVGYERREMELQIARLQDAFSTRHAEPLSRLRTATLDKLSHDEKHNADGTPR